MSERSCYALVLIIELVLLTVLLLKFSVLQALPTHGLSRLHSEFGHSVLLPALVMALLQSLILLAGQVVKVPIAANAAFPPAASKTFLSRHRHHVRIVDMNLLV